MLDAAADDEEDDGGVLVVDDPPDDGDPDDDDAAFDEDEPPQPALTASASKPATTVRRSTLGGTRSSTGAEPKRNDWAAGRVRYCPEALSLLTPLAVRIGSLSWMPKLLPQIVAVDRTLERVSRGRLSLLDVAGLPNLVLTTIGRKSGEPRRTPLLCVPAPDGVVLIAGSYFGGPKEPLWVANLEANPRVTITMNGSTRTVVAERLEGEKRAAAWQRMLRVWPNFALYETRTNRTIKVFALTPETFVS